MDAGGAAGAGSGAGAQVARPAAQPQAGVKAEGQDDEEGEGEEMVEVEVPPGDVPLFLDDLLVERGVEEEDEDDNGEEEREGDQTSWKKRRAKRAEKEIQRLRVLIATHHRDLLQLFLWYSKIESVKAVIAQNGHLAAAMVVQDEPALSEEAFLALAHGCGALLPHKPHDAQTYHKMCCTQSKRSGQQVGRTTPCSPLGSAAASREAGAEEKAAAPVSQSRECRSRSKAASRPAFGSSFEVGGGGRPIFCGRGDGGIAGGAGAVPSQTAAEGALMPEGLTGELAVRCCHAAQLREQLRVCDKERENAKRSHLASPDLVPADVLMFDEVWLRVCVSVRGGRPPKCGADLCVNDRSGALPLCHQDELLTCLDTSDHHTSIASSHGYGSRRNGLPCDEALGLLHKFGCQELTQESLRAKLSKLQDGVGQERPKEEEEGDLKGGWVTTQQIVEVFRAAQRRRRVEEETHGVLLRGFRMRRQLIQRPGFFSILVRLSLAYVISNRIPLISACPVSEAFSHCLRTLLLPRTLHLPGVIFAVVREDSKKGQTREKKGGLRKKKASVGAVSASSNSVEQMGGEGEVHDQRTLANEGKEVDHLETNHGGLPDTAEMSGREGTRKTGRRKGKAARVSTRIKGSGG